MVIQRYVIDVVVLEEPLPTRVSHVMRKEIGKIFHAGLGKDFADGSNFGVLSQSILTVILILLIL
jgi:hypothetical protein